MEGTENIFSDTNSLRSGCNVRCVRRNNFYPECDWN